MFFSNTYKDPEMRDDETWDEYTKRRDEWKKLYGIRMTQENSIIRRWVLIFLSSVLLFSLFFTPWRFHWQNNIMFYKYAPLFSTYENTQLGDMREIDVKRLVMWIFIFALVCGIGYMLQKPKK